MQICLRGKYARCPFIIKLDYMYMDIMLVAVEVCYQTLDIDTLSSVKIKGVMFGYEGSQMSETDTIIVLQNSYEELLQKQKLKLYSTCVLLSRYKPTV